MNSRVDARRMSMISFFIMSIELANVSRERGAGGREQGAGGRSKRSEDPAIDLQP